MRKFLQFSILVFLAAIFFAQTARAQNVAIQYSTLTDYSSGFTGQIKITNNGSQTVNGWTLSFDLANRTLQNAWDCDIVSHVGARYTVKNAVYNGVIAAGNSVTFGFTGAPGNITAIPVTNFVFNGAAVVQQTATTFSYQGRLSDGGASANGAYDLQFVLFDDGGAQIGQMLERADVAVTNGVFTVRLDFGDAAFTGGNRLLEIRVRRGAETGAFTALTPRQPIDAAPYSVRAVSAATADNALKLGGVVSQNFVLTTDSRLSDARTPLAGSASYIQNSATAQTASFNVSGTGTVGGNLTIGGNISGSGNLTIGGVVSSGCRSGFTAINNGRLCVSAIQPATNFYNAVNACTAMSARVGNSADVMQTFSQSGFNYFNNTTQGWLADHFGDDLWGTWNVAAPTANFDGAAINVAGSNVPFLPYRCVY